MSKKLFLTLSLFVSAAASCSDTQPTAPTITDIYQKCIELSKEGDTKKATDCFNFIVTQADRKITHNMIEMMGGIVVLAGKKLFDKAVVGDASLSLVDDIGILYIIANFISCSKNYSLKENAQLKKELISLNLDQNSAKNK